MSKKETEFDRYDRMRKIEREVKAQMRKNIDVDGNEENKKGGKPKVESDFARRSWSKVQTLKEEEYDYV